MPHRTLGPVALVLALATAACRESPRPEAELVRLAATDSLVTLALADLNNGLPWRASERLAPVLADSQRRTPIARLVAAQAAGAWGGWTEVDRLLTGVTWPDSLLSGEASELRAQSALARGQDSAAVAYANAALALAQTPVERGTRRVLLGRAWDRLDSLAAARAAYVTAADELPELADWLRLRAAGVTADSAARTAIYQDIDLPPARASIPATEAAALERLGQFSAAARQRLRMGQRARALGLQLAGARNVGDTVAARRGLLDLLAGRPRRTEALLAIAVLDSLPTSHTAAEQLVIARAADGAGNANRAAAGYRHALAAGLGAGQGSDRFAYANALARLGRHAQAAVQYRLVRAPRSLAADAAYLRARSLLRGGDDSARTELRQVIRRFPRDTAAAIARVLLADLATDAGDDDGARALLLETAARFPTTRFGPYGGYHAALIALAHGRNTTAAGELDELVRRWPQSEQAAGARYWAGRAWHQAGDTALARARWRQLASRADLSYYGVLAARRLGQSLTGLAQTADTGAVDDLADDLPRLRRLAAIGMDDELEAEFNWLVGQASRSNAWLWHTARLLDRLGRSWRIIPLGWQALGRVPPDQAYRLLYPLPFRDQVLATAREAELDPALIAALIRQESLFNPGATSSAGAMGLMQIMPELAGRMAQGSGFAVWDSVLLYQPDVNLVFGTRHLRRLLNQYGDLPRALAAYNAGGSRVERWVDRAGADDPELFTERIPFRETRGYVRAIVRNDAVYRALYRWGDATPPQPADTAP